MAIVGWVPGFSIVSAAPLMPDGLSALRSEADREGIANVSTLVERWIDGTQRYNSEGEVILAAAVGPEVVGIGALARCPDTPGALRMRRFYVTPGWRRRGVARSLASQLISYGFKYTDTITCNARASAAAPPFWESMGFSPVQMAGITDLRRR